MKENKATKMTVKMAEILQAANTLNRLYNHKLSVKPALRVRRFAKILNEEISLYHQTREALVDQHATKDDDGKPLQDGGRYVFRDQEAFESEHRELLDSEVEIEVIPMPPDWLERDEVKLSAGEIDTIAYLLAIGDDG